MTLQSKEEKLRNLRWLSVIIRYTGASGDFNPIHTVYGGTSWRTGGLCGVIAHGMLIIGMAGEAIQHGIQEKLHSFKVRFSPMTRPGEKVSIGGSIIEEKIAVGIVQVKNRSGEV